MHVVCSFRSFLCFLWQNMLLIPSITFYCHYNIRGCMCSTEPFKFRWLRRYIYISHYYHCQIGSILLSIVIIFSVAVCLRCLLHDFLSLIAYTFRKTLGFVFIIIAQFMMSANSRIHCGLQIVFVCLYVRPSHYHDCANLSEDIEHKTPVRYIMSSVWVRWHIFWG